MRRTYISLAAIAALLSQAAALTITSPTPGTSIDPTQPIIVTWTSTSADPSTIDLKIDDSNPNSLSTNQIIASNIPTSSGSFTIPANTIQNFGTGYQIQALGSGGGVIGQAVDLTLGAGADQVTTAANGQVSFVSAQTANPQPSSPSSGGVEASTTALGGSGTITASSSSGSATEGTTVLSGTVTAESTTATSSTRSSGFVTSGTSRTATSSSEASAGATSAANTNTANGLGGMRGAGEVVMGAAGVLAGLIAYLA